MALRDIRQRIRGVMSTQKITKGMKMISQIRLQKSERQAVSGRPYAGAVASLLARVGSAMSDEERSRFPLLNPREVKKVLVMVVTSDRGLCGNLNSGLLRKTLQQIIEWKTGGKEVSVIAIGTKGYLALRRQGLHLRNHFTHIPSPPTRSLAELLVEECLKAFDGGDADEVVIVYNKFISVSKHEVTFQRFLPAVVEGGGESAAGSEEGYTLPEFIYEPGPAAILGRLIPLYMEVQMLQILRDAAASEFAARMMAMDQATTNADRMIHDLTLKFNKARQSAITTEIIEVVSGAEALS